MSQDEAYAVAVSAALMVSWTNSIRGLLAAEAELNPGVEAVCVVLAADGSFEVTCTDAAGRPVGGYRL